VAAFSLSATGLTLTASQADAIMYFGRATTGGFVSSERHQAMSDGSTHNDVATFSSRLYFHATGIGQNSLEFVSDFRDKHDFFDKLDQERQALTDSNTLQVRQLFVRYPNRGGFIYTTLGRFAIPEAGSAYTDGAEVGLNLSEGLRYAGFAGANPHRDDRSYLEFDAKANIAGAYLSYQPKSRGWTNAFHTSTAFVNQSYSGQTDRRYLYQDLFYQWTTSSRLFYLLYLDFVPRTNLQTANVTYQQEIGAKTEVEASGLAVDVIEYRRRQSLREHLDPSPYHEARAKIRYHVNSNVLALASARSGRREVDGLSLNEETLGLSLPRLFSSKVDLSVEAGSRDQFVHHEPFCRLDLGYFSRIWELGFNAEYAAETYKDGTHLNPLTLELNSAHFLTQELILSLTGQYAKDQQVSIISFFVRLSYRFGNRELPPLRDGAPPNGRL
jgi:hypothetical protein